MDHETEDVPPQLEQVEWVVNHLEAHGQLLVRGSTVAEIVDRALPAAQARMFMRNIFRLRVHIGWWVTRPCRCPDALATSTHPHWHYHPAAKTEPGAWKGAEVRLFIQQHPGSGRQHRGHRAQHDRGGDQ